MSNYQASSAISPRRSGRLTMRRPVQADLDFMVALFARPELVAHRPHPYPDSPEVTATRFERDIDHWKRRGFGRWAIECGGSVIGFGGLTVKDGFDGLNMSYHLDPAFWGHGYASEFAAEALKVAFGPLKAARIVGLVRPANPASRRVLERVGFVAEAEIMLDGAPTTLFACHA